ncbi:hypothetical protein [Streptomyces sp. PT12]|uniref:hypothetical protein n=1 Tax=Streptomyces sp. PT12 TaxID=1510197 RepID=UPI000DE1C5B7|nr:hypothetical protein [Streptomyces sp. PT12]RBM23949.1 hypothetical protein DEH69_01330 [Streptomyces sp. PT12]
MSTATPQAHRDGHVAAGLLLDAGAVLPLDDPRGSGGDDVDILTARAYTHPALDERPVVRLVAETLGEAEDLALGYLGLVRDEAEEAPRVGRVRRESLGFPAWALVNDPANGHHALALVQDIERLARTAASRAGAAKDGFDQLGDRLGRSVPHFLPTFYEQAARVFLSHENTSYAAMFFGKARAAERVHDLEVDEARQRAVFLEFAFAGALTVKALRDHVKDLTRRLPPEEAWRQFRQLTVERCAAGMPPYASLAADSRKLVRAAGLDVAAEERALVGELLDHSSVVDAPPSFWTGYRSTLVDLAAERPGIRHRLLSLMPSQLSVEGGGDATWLDLLAATGAEQLLADDPREAAQGEGGEGQRPSAADWLSRWSAHLQRGWSPHRSPATYALARRLAPRLRADGVPVASSGRRRGWHDGADVELLDACLAEGAPVADPADGLVLDMDDWFGAPDDERCDFAALAADPRYRPLLTASVGATAQHRDPERLTTAAAHPVLRELLRDWLAARADEVTAATALPAAREALDRLVAAERVADDVHPDALARVTAHDLAPLVARTLRAGIFDELGWPALEEGMRLMAPHVSGNGARALGVEEAWPGVILGNSAKAVVVGPDRVLIDHDVRIPDTDLWRRPTFRYVDGELLVTWWADGGQRAYWSSRPDDIFPLGGAHLSRSGVLPCRVAPPLPGGGLVTGGRAVHAGDTSYPQEAAVLADGTAYWRLEHRQRGNVWREFDPVTGEGGRDSLPAFLAGGAADGARLIPHYCSLLPMASGLEATPLGTDGSLLGWWVRYEEADGGTFRARGTDGRTVSLTRGTPAYISPSQPVPIGALRLPGGAEPVLAISRNNVSLFPDGADRATGALGSAPVSARGGAFAAGTPLMPPVPLLHALRVRDETGSLALREVTDATATRLIAAVADLDAAFARPDSEDREAGRTPDPAARAKEWERALVDAVGAELPAVKDRSLLRGVAGIVRFAIRMSRSIARLTGPRQDEPKADGPMFADYQPLHGADREIAEAVGTLTERPIRRLWSKGLWSCLQQIRAVNHVLNGKPATGAPLTAADRAETLPDGWRAEPRTAPWGSGDWTGLLGRLHALAYHATGPAVDDTAREALLLLLAAVAEGPLAGGAGALRTTVLKEPGSALQRGGHVLRRGSRTVVILGRLGHPGQNDRHTWLAMDHDPEGAFGPVAHFTTFKAYPVAPGPGAAYLAELVRLVRERGPLPWRPETAAAFAEATGAGTVQATLLLAGLTRAPRTPADLGLKVGQARKAAALLPPESHELLAALLRDDPAALWDSGPDTEKAARRWTALFGARLRIPEELADELNIGGMGEAVLNPQDTPWLTRTTTQRLGAHGQVEADDSTLLPSRFLLSGAVGALAALGHGLPYGHPLRAALPAGLDALRRRLADPGLLLDLHLQWSADGKPTAKKIRAAHGMPDEGGAGPDGMTRVGDAFVLAPWYSGSEYLWLRPAGLSGPDDPALGLVQGLLPPSSEGRLTHLRTLLGPDIDRLLAAGHGDADGFTGYAQDPTLSVPGLVAEVAAHHGLGEDAAALYLQLLALPAPTDRARARWTGWKPARAKRAAAELSATDLVVTAQRSRAGRKLFLPCGWLERGAPLLPVETWKAGLYPIEGPIVPLTPVPELFARAWARVTAGDGPAYEELVTRATRKGRR